MQIVVFHHPHRGPQERLRGKKQEPQMSSSSSATFYRGPASSFHRATRSPSWCRTLSSLSRGRCLPSLWSQLLLVAPDELLRPQCCSNCICIPHSAAHVCVCVYTLAPHRDHRMPQPTHTHTHTLNKVRAAFNQDDLSVYWRLFSI